MSKLHTDKKINQENHKSESKNNPEDTALQKGSLVN